MTRQLWRFANFELHYCKPVRLPSAQLQATDLAVPTSVTLESRVCGAISFAMVIRTVSR